MTLNLIDQRLISSRFIKTPLLRTKIFNRVESIENISSKQKINSLKFNFQILIRNVNTTQIKKSNFYFHPNFRENAVKDFEVVEDFINDEEESVLVNEVEPHLKRLHYEFDHWDDAIHGYRETEKGKWSKKCTPIIRRISERSFSESGKTLDIIPQVHILDLDAKGVIKPHVDSVRFCGRIISGISLLSDSVMRLVDEKNKDKIVDILLKRKSLYIMRDSMRYDFTHEILSQADSYFGAKYVEKNRRISIICRMPP